MTLLRRGLVVVGAIVLSLTLVACTPDATVALDLVDHLPYATQRRPSAEAFQVLPVALGQQTRRAIYVAEPSRLVWYVTIPARARLSFSVGVREEVWTRESHGVLFLVGVSDSGRYQELASLIVNPYANPADRAWLPIDADLSPWAGRTVELVFNTRVALAGTEPMHHLAMWGEPRVVVR